MKNIVVYIHGKHGSAQEASHYGSLFADCDVVGFDYKAKTPREAKEEFPPYFDAVFKKYDSAMLVANSIGAFFAMHALTDAPIKKAFFISPRRKYGKFDRKYDGASKRKRKRATRKRRAGHQLRRKTFVKIPLLRKAKTHLLDGAYAYFIRRKRRSDTV